jgi:hypothetical protein
MIHLWPLLARATKSKPALRDNRTRNNLLRETVQVHHRLPSRHPKGPVPTRRRGYQNHRLLLRRDLTIIVLGTVEATTPNEWTRTKTNGRVLGRTIITIVHATRSTRRKNATRAGTATETAREAVMACPEAAVGVKVAQQVEGETEAAGAGTRTPMALEQAALPPQIGRWLRGLQSNSGKSLWRSWTCLLLLLTAFILNIFEYPFLRVFLGVLYYPV